MVAANKLLHLLEAFSTTWFLFSAAQNHHLVFFLLEVFNNIIQYQFDGEAPAQAPGPALVTGDPGWAVGEDSFPSEEDRALRPPVYLSCMHLLSACCIPRPGPGEGIQWETEQSASCPVELAAGEGGMEGDSKQMVTQTNRSS